MEPFCTVEYNMNEKEKKTRVCAFYAYEICWMSTYYKRLYTVVMGLWVVDNILKSLERATTTDNVDGKIGWFR